MGLLGGALMLATAVGPASAAQLGGDVEGSVAYVDFAARTITFQDGRIAQLDPDAKIFIDGREVTQVVETRHNVWVPVVETPVRTTTVVQGPPQQAMAVTDQGVVIYRDYPVVAVTRTTDVAQPVIPTTGFYARIDGRDVLLVRRHQAP
jgi:hypothetical protein